MKKRHPICNHTLAAVRARKQAFKISVYAIAGGQLDNATVRNLVDAAEMAFTEIDPDEMPEASEAKVIVGHRGPQMR